MSIPTLGYVNYDFESLRVALENRLKLQSAWKDTYRSATGQMIIELFAAVDNMNLFYVERTADESHWKTARNKSSLINMAALLNYTPKRNVSAVGILQFTLAAPSPNIIFIPQYTECQTVGGVKFLTLDQDATIMPGGLTVSPQAMQGELVDLEYASAGGANQEYNIKDTAVENTHIEVRVSGVLWTAVDSFIDSVNTSLNYIVRAELDDTVTIVFGDDVQGKSPIVGEGIKVRYVRSLGLSGCVYNLGSIIQINNVIYDAGVPVTVSVLNTTTFLGGDDAEGTEEIRYEAPRVFKTGDRLVTSADYIAILENYPGIANANVWGENEENPPNYDMFNQVKICILLQEWVLPSVEFLALLSDYLYTKSMMTVRYSYVVPEVIYVIPETSIKVLNGYSLSYIASQVTGIIEGDFTLGETTKLGIDKRISDLVAAVEGVDGVAYSHSKYKIYKELIFGGATYDTIVDVLDIALRSADIYIGGTLVATDNGVGVFVDVAGDPWTVTGTVNYTTGAIAVSIVGAVTGTVSIRYEQDGESGDIVVDLSQICKLQEVDIQDISYSS